MTLIQVLPAHVGVNAHLSRRGIQTMVNLTRSISRGLVPLVALLVSSACIAQQPAAQEATQPATQEATQPAAQEATQIDRSTRYQLMVEYASTNLRLAEVELEYALEENAKNAGMIPRITIERLRSNLSLARKQFEEATAASTGGLERIQLRHAEERIRLSKLDLQNGQRLYDEGMVSALELQRLELKHDLAKLNLVLLKNPENFVTLLHHLESKVNRMGEEILMLDQRISKLEPTRGMLPKN